MREKEGTETEAGARVNRSLMKFNARHTVGKERMESE